MWFWVLASVRRCGGGWDRAVFGPGWAHFGCGGELARVSIAMRGDAVSWEAVVLGPSCWWRAIWGCHFPVCLGNDVCLCG